MKPAVAICSILAGGLVLASGGYWLARHAREGGAAATLRSRDGIMTVAANTHKILPSTAPDGTPRVAPALPSLEQAIALESRLGFDLRLEVVHSLTAGGLAQKQADELLAFVAEKRLPAGLTISQVRALKNDILNVLVLRPASAQALAAVLRAIHDDPTQDPGMRDYALQTLAEIADVAGAESQWRAVQGQDPALAATAMLQLLSFSRSGHLPAKDKDRLAQAAAKLAADASLPETSRATALQVCGQLKVLAARPLAYEIARSDKASFSFRIAAVATLGDLGGDAQTQAYLQQLAAGPEKRLRVPAISALKRFSIN